MSCFAHMRKSTSTRHAAFFKRMYRLVALPPCGALFRGRVYWLKQSLIFLLIVLFTAPAMLQAQITDEEIIKLLAQYDLPTVRAKVAGIYRQRPSSAPAAYWRASMTEDGEEAAELFDEILLRFRNSDFADRAIYRLAQYHFARGNYNTAQKYFFDLKQRYPKSPLYPAARYFAAKSWLAAGQADSAFVELNACVQSFPASWVAQLAKEDLDGLAPEELQKLQAAQPRYTVQIGAYSKRNNALKQADKLRDLNYQAEVVERPQEKESMHLVWVGNFASREEADRVADDLKKKIRESIQIVIREP